MPDSGRTSSCSCACSRPAILNSRLVGGQRSRQREVPLRYSSIFHWYRYFFRETKVTFFVGENGSGKSTLLEALAAGCGFNPEGGSRNHSYARQAEPPALTPHLRLAWSPKVTKGFFHRAESFFNFASNIDALGLGDAYGGKSLHLQSHGESFPSLFTSRFQAGLFILDEPEAALSPQRQLTFLRILHDLESGRRSQVIIATHSPILLSYPNATIYSLDGEEIVAVNAEETDHVRLTRDFLNSPERYLRRLFYSADEEK